MKLSKKVALITGSSRGIGKAIVLRLADDGFRVVINYNKSKVEAFKIAETLKKRKKEFIIVKADVSKEAEVKKMIGIVINKFKSIDVIVNNAGINQNQKLENLKIKDFNKIIDTNLKGNVLVTKYSLPFLKRSKYSRIIFISSTNSFIGSPRKIAYTISKSAILGLAKSLALDLAPKILVNTIVPGYINTEMFRKFDTKTNEHRINQIPIRRLGKPEEVASLVSFLCSSDASYITGQCFHVNGGVFLS